MSRYRLQNRKRASRGRVLGILLVGLVVISGGAWLAHEHFGRPVAHMAHWWEEARAPVEPNAIRIAILGDSSAVGIGASRPSESMAGRVVAHLRGCSARPVYVSNVAVGGARVSDAREQARSANLNDADLVLVSVGSSDVMAGVSLNEFERDLAALFDELPSDRTVFSDIAAVPEHRDYQSVFEVMADDRGIVRAQFEEAFQAAGRLDVFAPDNLHLNSVGYGIWFGSIRPAVDGVVGNCPAS